MYVDVYGSLVKVESVQRECSIFVLIEVLSSVLECVWPGARLYAQKFKACAYAQDRKLNMKLNLLQHRVGVE